MKQENMHSKFDIFPSNNLNEDKESMFKSANEDDLQKSNEDSYVILSNKIPLSLYTYLQQAFKIQLVDLLRLCNYIELPFEIIGQVLTKNKLPDDMFSNQHIFSRCTFFDVLGKKVEPLAEIGKGEGNKSDEYSLIVKNSNVQFIYKSLKDIVFYQYDTITQSNVIDFCDKIMTKGDLAEISWQHVNSEKRKYWMSYLKTRITVKFVKEKDMPEPNIPKAYKSDIRENRSKGIDIEKITEWLGCYCSKTMEILLCPERIKNASNKLYNNLKPEEKTNIHQDYCEQVIFAMVLIHEFAHAILDPTNLADRTINKPVFDYNIDDELSFFIEESLANMIMLKYFDASFKEESKKESKELLIVKKFVESQSEAYKFGQNMYDANDVDWSLWRDKKSILSQKTNQQQCLIDLRTAKTDALKNVYEQLFLYEPGE